MSDDTNTTTVDAQQSKTTTNYAVYEAPDAGDSQALTGMYVTLELGADGWPFDFIEVEFSEAGEGALDVHLDRETSNYGVYETEGGAITGMYVSHDVLAQFGDGDEVPETVGISIREGSEEAFEEARTAAEEAFEEGRTAAEAAEEADALLAE